ncbi:hypothetical protein EMIT0215P_180018 [Pseudomonas serboccidentalis]
MDQAGLRAHEQRIAWLRAFPLLARQWLKAQLLLIYRCGGSAGIVIVLHLKTTLTGFPVSLCRRTSQST